MQNKGITLIGVFGLVSARVRGFLADLNCVQEKAHKKMEFTRTCVLTYCKIPHYESLRLNFL